jgi:hypothetical protein
MAQHEPPPTPAHAVVNDLVPMAHVTNVDRSIRFYRLLGLRVTDALKDVQGRVCWAWVSNQKANLMLARANAPVAADLQSALFYLYSDHVVALRSHLLACGLRDRGGYCGQPLTGDTAGEVFAITHPQHMPAGECRVHDPDGYCLLIGQLR